MVELRRYGCNDHNGGVSDETYEAPLTVTLFHGRSKAVMSEFLKEASQS